MESTLGKRIAAHRIRLGWTREDLAEKLGVTAQTVDEWEADRTCPDIYMLAKLAQLFGITTDELMGMQTAPRSKALSFQLTNRRSQLFFALWVLLSGTFLLINNLMGWDANLWDILWTVGLMTFGISGLIAGFSFFRLGCTLFGGYFLIENLGFLDFALKKSMLLPVIFVLFGIALVCSAIRKPKARGFTVKHHGVETWIGKNDREEYPDGFRFRTSFGEQIHRICLPLLRHGEISVCFGSLVLDLTGCHAFGPALLNASCAFGQLTLRVPRFCRVVSKAGSHFGSVAIQGTPWETADQTLTLCGDVSFGEIVIQYV